MTLDRRRYLISVILRLKFQAIDRLAVLEVATADSRADSEELKARMEMLSKDLRALTKSYLKMRSELADFQSRVSFDNPEAGSDNGRLD